tara:strand:- start:239 stop:421 length:183 start_codon:yes stop_codon:yes gene_type:complete
MTIFAITLWLITGEITIPLQQGVGCDEYYKYLEEIERITYDIPYTYFDTVHLIGYSCSIF